MFTHVNSNEPLNPFPFWVAANQQLGLIPSLSSTRCLMGETVVTLTSGYATMVYGRGCNPHRCTATFANVEITSLMTS